MHLLCYYEVQSIHNLLLFLSQTLIYSLSGDPKGKSRDLQKLLRCLNSIITLMFKHGTVDCGGWYASSSFPDLGDLSGLSPTIFGLYLNEYSSETLPSTSLISSQ